MTNSIIKGVRKSQALISYSSYLYRMPCYSIIPSPSYSMPNLCINHHKREFKEGLEERKRVFFYLGILDGVPKVCEKGSCKGCRPSPHVFEGKFKSKLDEKPMKELTLQ